MTSGETPLLKQYLKIKRNYPDAILFFRMGDFYEMFYEDAIIASKELSILLTSRNKNKEENVPMCGIPWHSADNYIARLIKKGYKVAICEQLEDPSQATGIVKRDVIKVYTPSTFDGEDITFATEQYLLSLVIIKQNVGIAIVEPTTGEMKTTEIHIDELKSKLMDIFSMFNIKEVIHPLSHSITSIIPTGIEIYSTAIPDWVFDPEYGRSLLMEKFKTNTLSMFNIEKKNAAIASCAAAIHYLKEIQKSDLIHINSIKFLNFSEYLILDSITIRNLELIRNMISGDKSSSLYGILDLTMSPLGSRLLKQWIIHPLLDIKMIEERLDAIEELNNDAILRGSLRTLLKKIVDMDRICSRIGTNSILPKDLLLLNQSLKVIPDIKKALTSLRSNLINKIKAELDDCTEIVNIISNSIVELPSNNIKEGGIIKEGFDKELDELREVIKNGKTYIARLENEEKRRTGIGNLKIGYNKIFGYYIEVTKSNLNLIPSDYERKQTLVNAERFVTPVLKEYEKKVLGAEEKVKDLEYEIYCKIRGEVKKYLEIIQNNSRALAILDVITTLSEAACKYKYCRPNVHKGTHILIKNGRHPVLERLQIEQFIPNDTYLNNTDAQILILTGPNMGGKSTYLRQVSLICLMAHIGSFVPADKAEICLIDKIFTRVGASDNLVQGQSTFMVEMLEASNILNNATPRSLIILDEIGRGTSTFDGMAIAWAIIEYLHNNPKIAAKTLFATHFHELTNLASSLNRIKNYSIAVKEWKDQIIFLRKIIQGPSDKSYGIQVARLAGFPEKIITRAKEVLSFLEKTKKNYQEESNLIPESREYSSSVSIFSTAEKDIIQEIKKIDVENLTPIEAFKIILKLKEALKEQKNDNERK